MAPLYNEKCREITKQGWIEISRKQIIIKHIWTKPFQTVENWIEFHIKHPRLFKRNRSHCNYCGRPFKDLNIKGQHIYIIPTNVGNKIVCEMCLRILRELHPDKVRQYKKEDEKAGSR